MLLLPSHPFVGPTGFHTMSIMFQSQYLQLGLAKLSIQRENCLQVLDEKKLHTLVPIGASLLHTSS